MSMQSPSSLRLLSPGSQSAIPLLREDWKEILKTRVSEEHEEAPQHHLDSLMHPLPVSFSWQGGTPPYTLRLMPTQGSLGIRRLTTEQHSAELTNLLVSTEYRWKVADAQGQCAEGRFCTAASPRLIELPNSHAVPLNVRDAGGYRNADGDYMRQGILYRGASFDDFAPSSAVNRAFFRRVLRIRTEVDLRYPENVGDRTSSPLGKGVRWLHRPINAYQAFEPEQVKRFRDAMALFARQELYPIYFHCAGGSDRTGEIAFLLQGLLGVSEEDALLDYELSSLSIFPRSRNIPYFQEWRRRIASHAPAGAPLARQIEKYLLSIGVTRRQIVQIRENLLCSTP